MIDCTYERLCLAKRGNGIYSSRDIYVDKCPAIQHLRDGIRFLYNSLIKKKRGVILNDPSNYGKRVQTVLFISAILPTLDKPVLILCRDEEKQLLWMETFQDWTSLSGDEYNVETENQFAKKKILISLTKVAEAFSRRDWSLLVLDDDLVLKKMRQLKAQFRIWVTSDSIKQYLNKFTTFLTWINAKEKFDIAKYKANENDPVDVYTKLVMLDAFMEDYVLRRDCSKSIADAQVSKTIQSKTKVDKDGTGIEIKDLKRKAEEIDHGDETKSIKIATTEEQNIVSTDHIKNINDVNMNKYRE